jgi:transposase
MSKYDTQFKLAVVQEYLRAGGKKRIAIRVGINPSDVVKWASAYQAHGLASLEQREYRQYPPEFKLEVLEYMQAQHVSVRDAAAYFNIASPSTIVVWQRLYNEGGITALQPKPKGSPLKFNTKDIKALLARPITELTHEELLRRAQYLEVENAYLKKLEALAQQQDLANKHKSK